MTLHSNAIEWVNEKVRGKITHGRTIPKAMCQGRIPDIIKQDKKGNLLEIHEVEAPQMLIGKTGYDDPFTLRPKRILWVTLPNLGHMFHEVHLIIETKHGFKEIASLP